MPRHTNTITLELDRDTTLEISGQKGGPRTTVTVHQVTSREKSLVEATVLDFRLTPDTLRTLADSLDLFR